ncbi:hypothetical protein [Blastococcus brunescens]|uniref:Uncharacterized protein n=1 Tax=Blastococcus brunescens TaxID=1564165 RepID=A0ABZ1AVJ3_9ACTN|nr:hypothetical protein [Blastococcus sp. BMG 8361]WRL62162.1 hypothetical protein U6N30_19185 [Blastococcus sp. BMG 8361]
MSAATLAVRTAEPGAATVFARAASAEWVRLRTVRTTLWCLLAATVTIVGIGVVMAFDAENVTATGDFRRRRRPESSACCWGSSRCW